ncbi:MAG: hypothetical protein A2Z18_08475 [Armatimonadetes bacterium RBG_16_58_9]|nr:MAG: hypothetical protein A2Z18_08475 [Armatimonadetes bacterium RBG_16_58_9]
MDGVLADTEPLHGECFIRAFEQLGVHADLEHYRQAVTLGGSTVRDYYLSLGGDPCDWDALKAIKDPMLEELVAEKGVLMPGVVDLLRALKSEGIPVAVATSARRKTMSIILNRFGLWDFFDAFITKDNVEHEKPDPAVFLLAARKLGVDPARCVVVEDSPRGVAAAERAGMKCLACPNPSTADGDFSGATLVVASLEDVDVQTLRGLFTS